MFHRTARRRKLQYRAAEIVAPVGPVEGRFLTEASESNLSKVRGQMSCRAYRNLPSPHECRIGPNRTMIGLIAQI